MLSATAQLYARAEKLFTLPPGAFVPPPKVHSTLLRLTIEPRQETLGVSPGTGLWISCAFRLARSARRCGTT